MEKSTYQLISENQGKKNTGSVKGIFVILKFLIKGNLVCYNLLPKEPHRQSNSSQYYYWKLNPGGLWIFVGWYLKFSVLGVCGLFHKVYLISEELNYIG